MVQTQIIHSHKISKFDEMLNGFLEKLDKKNFELIDIKFNVFITPVGDDELPDNNHLYALVLFKLLEVTPEMLGESGQ